MNGPVLAFGSEHPADLLNNALAVTNFLSDVAPHFTTDFGGCGLTGQSAHGLGLILISVGATIDRALVDLNAGD
jgi:hypothetical protein